VLAVILLSAWGPDVPSHVVVAILMMPVAYAYLLIASAVFEGCISLWSKDTQEALAYKGSRRIWWISSLGVILILIIFISLFWPMAMLIAFGIKKTRAKQREGGKDA